MRSYKIIRDDLARRIVRDGMYVSLRKPYIKSPIDIQMDFLKSKLRAANERSEAKISLTAYLISAYASLLKKFPNANALLDFKGDLFVFEQIDIMLPIAIHHQGRPAIKYALLKNVNLKSLQEISKELQLIKQDRTIDKMPRSHRFFLKLPGFARRFGYRLLEAFPGRFRQFLGTAVLSNTIVEAQLLDGLPIHSTGIFTVGSRKVSSIGESIEIMPAQLCLDHRVGDGEMLLQMALYFKEYIESARGLDASSTHTV